MFKEGKEEKNRPCDPLSEQGFYGIKEKVVTL